MKCKKALTYTLILAFPGRRRIERCRVVWMIWEVPPRGVGGSSLQRAPRKPPDESGTVRAMIESDRSEKRT